MSVPDPQSRTSFNFARLAVQWLIPVAILVAFIVTGQLSDAIHALSDVSLIWAVPLILVGTGLPLSHAWRWCFLLKRIGESIPLAVSARVTSLASLINYAAPGFLGAPAKAVLVRDSHKIPVSRSLPTLAMEQVLDALLLLAMGTLAVLLTGPTLMEALREQMSSVSFEEKVVLALSLVTVIVALVLGWLVVRRFLPSFLDALRSASVTLLRSTDYRFPIASLTITRWVLDMLAVGIASIAVGLRLSLIEILLIANLSLFVGLLSPVPGGLGVREAVMAAIAGAIGVSIPAILALSVLHRAGLALGLPIVLIGARAREWSAR